MYQKLLCICHATFIQNKLSQHMALIPANTNVLIQNFEV